MIISPKKSDRRPLEDIHNVLRSPISERGVQVSDQDENRYANPSLTPKKRRLGSSIQICQNDDENPSSLYSMSPNVRKIENQGETLSTSRLAIAMSPNFNSPQMKVKHLRSTTLLIDELQSPKSNSKKRKDVSMENRSIIHDDVENKDPYNMKSPLRMKVTYKANSGKILLDQETPKESKVLPPEMKCISENIAIQSSTLFNGDAHAPGNDTSTEPASADSTHRYMQESQAVLGDDIATFYLSTFNSFSSESVGPNDDRIGVEADLRPSAIGSNMGSGVGDDYCQPPIVPRKKSLFEYGITGPETKFGNTHAHDEKVSSSTHEIVQPARNEHFSDCCSLGGISKATLNAAESDTDFSYAYILRDIERMKLQRQAVVIDNPNSKSYSKHLPTQQLSTAVLDMNERKNALPHYSSSASSTKIDSAQLDCREEASESVKKTEEIHQSTPQKSSVHHGHASVCHSMSSSDASMEKEAGLESSTTKKDPIPTSTQTAQTRSSEAHPQQQVPSPVEESEEDREDREFSSFRATIAAARASSVCVLLRGSRGRVGQGLTPVQQQAVAFHKSEVDFLSSSALLRIGEVLVPLGTQGGDTTVLCTPRQTPERSSMDAISCDLDLSISGTVVTVICSDDHLSQSHYLSTRVPLSELNAYQEKVQSWKGKYKTSKPLLTSKHFPGYLPHLVAESSAVQGAAVEVSGSSAATSPSSRNTFSSTPSRIGEEKVPLTGQDAAAQAAVAEGETQEYCNVQEPSNNSNASPALPSQEQPFL